MCANLNQISLFRNGGLFTSDRTLAGDMTLLGKTVSGLTDFIPAPTNVFQATNPYSISGDVMRRQVLSSTLIADEEAPQVANSFLEATERLLKQGSRYKEKHQDNSRRLAGTFVVVGSEQHPESVKDFLEKKRREARDALIESEESVRLQAKRKEGYLLPDLEWEKFKETAVSQYLAAGRGGMLALLRSQRQRSLDVVGSQAGFGDRQLTKEELLFAQTLRECNDEIISTHSAVSSLPERFSSVLSASSTDKTARELWSAFSALVTQVRSDARMLTTPDQVAAFRLSDTFTKQVIASARAYLEASAYAAAEEYIRNPVRDIGASAAAGESSNAVISYARSQLAKNKLAVDVAGTRLHGMPVWALIFYAVRLGALKAALSFCGQGDESTREFVRYLTEYQRNNGALLVTSALELQTSYRNQIIDSGHADLYKRAVMAIVSRSEPEQDFGGITHSVSDWLWMKLAQTEVISSSPCDMSLYQLQHIIRSRFPPRQTDDCEAFFAFILTGQFELAVERLFLNLKFRPYAVCMAMALKQAKLLLISYGSQAGAASVIAEREQMSFLDFASVVRIYVEGFRRRHIDHALEYYFHLSDTPAVQATACDHRFPNLFEFCVYKLAKDTGAYGELFGRSEGAPGQIPRKGLVSRLLQDSSRVIVAVAQDLIHNGDLVDGMRLLETAKQITALFRTLLKVLSADVIFPTTASGRQELQKLATGYAERYQVTGSESDVVIRNVYFMLDLVTFLNMVDNQEFRQALAAMKSINLIPLEQNAVGTAVAMFQRDLLPETRECMPYVTLQTMQTLCNCYTTEKERLLSSRMGAEVLSPLRTANLQVSGARLSDGLLKLQAAYRKQSRAILEFASKIPLPQLPNLMDLLIKLEASLS